MSSLPFLAPVFVRKAKAYRSKGSGGYDSSGGRSRSKGSSKGRSTKEHYPLNDFDAAGSAFPGDARVKSESEESVMICGVSANEIREVIWDFREDIQRRGIVCVGVRGDDLA